MLWLVAHHVGFTVRGAGQIGLLPLGLVLLPGVLLAMAGRWVVRAGAVTRLRHVGYAAVALALPYALLAGALAVATRTDVASPSLLQAVIASSCWPWWRVASAARAGWRRGPAGQPDVGPAALDRPGHARLGAVLAAAGAVLAGASLAVHLPEVRVASDALSPGVGGRGAAAAGPSWPTSRTPSSGRSPTPSVPASPSAPARWSPRPDRRSARSRSSRCSRPSRPTPGRAARPGRGGARPALPGRRLFAGIVTVRIAPTPVIEAAPLWGFAAGTAAGALAGLAAAFAGGPLGTAAWPRSARPVSRSAWWPSSRSASPPAGRRGRQLAHPAAARRSDTASPPRPSPRPQLRPGPGLLPPGQHDEADDASGHRIYPQPLGRRPGDDLDDDEEIPRPHRGDRRVPRRAADAGLTGRSAGC